MRSATSAGARSPSKSVPFGRSARTLLTKVVRRASMCAPGAPGTYLLAPLARRNTPAVHRPSADHLLTVQTVRFLL